MKRIFKQNWLFQNNTDLLNILIMKLIQKSFRSFATLNAQFLANRTKNAVRFQAQNINWDYEEVNFQALSLSKGLSSLSYQKGDTILLRVPAAQQAQAYIAKLGTAVISRAKTVEEAGAQIKSNNAKGIIFEPTLPLGDTLYIDALNQLIPELKTTQNGAKLKSKQFPNLLSLIQTNFYSYPGVYKFRSVLNYAEDKYFKINYDVQHEPISLPSSKNPIFVTNPAQQFSFRAGVLNSVIKGRYLVVVEPNQFNKISQIHDNKVDFIATEQVQGLSPSVNVYVQKGSTLLKNHANRTEL